MNLNFFYLSVCLLLCACSSETYYGNYTEVTEKQELVANLPDDKEYNLDDIKIQSHEEAEKQMCLNNKKYKDLNCSKYKN